MSRPPLDELIREFERLSLDEHLFWQFKNDEDLDVCVSFRRADPRPWSVWLKLSPDASRQTCSGTHVIPILNAFRVNENKFGEEISGALLVQAAYADEFIHQVSAIVGDEAVRMSIRETQKFIKELGSTIGQLLDKKEDTQTIDNSAHSERPATSTLDAGNDSRLTKHHLRIIKK